MGLSSSGNLPVLSSIESPAAAALDGTHDAVGDFVEEFAQDEVDNGDWIESDAHTFNESQSETEWDIAASEEVWDKAGSDTILPNEAPAPRRAGQPMTIRTATCRRPPPRADPPNTRCPQRTSTIRKATVRRPPPKNPHPDDQKKSARPPSPLQAPSDEKVPVPTASNSGELQRTMQPKPAVHIPRSRALVARASLMEAMASRDYPAMQKALETATDSEVHASMLNACARGNEKAVSILLANAPTLSIAEGAAVSARGGHSAVLALLLANAYDASVFNVALVQAAHRGHVQITAQIIQRRKADADATRRAILSAAAKNHRKVVECLVPAVVWADRRDAIISSCSNGHVDTACFLVKGLPGRFFDKPLGFAASKGNVVLVNAILSSEGSSELDPDVTLHARAIAQSKGHRAVVDALSSFITLYFPGEEAEGPFSPSSLPAL